MQTQPYHEPGGSRVFITSSEAQFIVYLKKVGQSYSLPRPQEARGHLPIFLGALGLDVDPMAINIHDIE
jgi:hypothetical protein